jgi:GNAT superfamily N-acetyltransferase
LRPAADADRRFLFEVYASTRIDELALTDWSPDQKQVFLTQQFSAQDETYRARYPDGEFSIITLNDRPIGRLYLGRLPGEIRVVDITLLPAFRGQGIGSRLIRNVMDEAARVGGRVTLFVEAFNPAHRLYTRLGFTRIDEYGVYELLEWRPTSTVS